MDQLLGTSWSFGIDPTFTISCTVAVIGPHGSSLLNYNTGSMPLDPIFSTERNGVCTVTVPTLVTVLRENATRVGSPFPPRLQAILQAFSVVDIETTRVPYFGEHWQDSTYGHRPVTSLVPATTELSIPSVHQDVLNETFAVDLAHPKTRDYLGTWGALITLRPETHFVIAFLTPPDPRQIFFPYGHHGTIPSVVNYPLPPFAPHYSQHMLPDIPADNFLHPPFAPHDSQHMLPDIPADNLLHPPFAPHYSQHMLQDIPANNLLHPPFAPNYSQHMLPDIPIDNLLHPSFLFPEAVGLDFTSTSIPTPADLLHPSVPFSTAANILGLESTSIDSAFFVRGQQTLSQMVRNWQAAELVRERFGVSPDHLQHQFAGGLAVTLDEVLRHLGWNLTSYKKKCTWFQWAEQASKKVWHTPSAPCQTDTTFALFRIWKAICFLWKAGGPIATGWEPSKVSTDDDEKDAAVLTQAIIESSKTKLSVLLRDQR
ncbi:hypothetical protein B0H16DRAFT_1888586 [Mycena metata]|uniref:Uncharacterized protein n=1 Tax=Mycena metata TaxID=1033252 RepID=A0AAD7IQ71_9AGAR|nr:hypothetical protein B0H16DRAFT_1888586 [Mycena metata]